MSALAAALPQSFGREICQAVVELASVAFPSGLRSIVLTGSLARGEGTWLRDGARTRVAGDAEFLMIFEDSAELPSVDAIVRYRQVVTSRLAARAIDVQVGLSSVKTRYLVKLRPHIFAYELIVHGKVIYGDQSILALAHAFTAPEIPLEDGFRTLLNRMIELLEALCEVEESGTITERVHYRAVKLTLDMASSYLVFRGQYEPTYRARAARLQKLAATSVSSAFAIQPLSNLVAEATRYKLDGFDRDASMAATDLIELVNQSHALWLWELKNLVGISRGDSDSELMRAWIGDQELSERLRGWASVAKRSATQCNLIHLLLWLARSAEGSPRRLIYGAASELFFALPGLLWGDEKKVNHSHWEKLLRELPVAKPPDGVPAAANWRGLGCSIAWNYHQFIESTRS